MRHKPDLFAKHDWQHVKLCALAIQGAFGATAPSRSENGGFDHLRNTHVYIEIGLL